MIRFNCALSCVVAIIWGNAQESRADSAPSWTAKLRGGWSRPLADGTHLRRPIADIAWAGGNEVVIAYADGETSGRVEAEWLAVGSSTRLASANVLIDSTPVSAPTIRRAEGGPFRGPAICADRGLAAFFVVERGHSTNVVRAENCGATGRRFVTAASVSGTSQAPSVAMWTIVSPFTRASSNGGAVLYGRADNVYIRTLTATGTFDGPELLVYDGVSGTENIFSTIAWNGSKFIASFTMLGAEFGPGCKTYRAVLRANGTVDGTITQMGKCDAATRGHYGTMASRLGTGRVAWWSEWVTAEAPSKGIRLIDGLGAWVTSAATFDTAGLSTPLTTSSSDSDPYHYYAVSYSTSPGQMFLHGFLAGWSAWDAVDTLTTGAAVAIFPLGLVHLPGFAVVVWREYGSSSFITKVSAYPTAF